MLTSKEHKEIKVGDLVEVLPGRSLQCIVTSLDAWDHIELDGLTLRRNMPDCVMLSHPLYGPTPMHKDYVEVISESR